MRKWVSWTWFPAPSFCCLFWSESSPAYAVVLWEASATALVLWSVPARPGGRLRGQHCIFSERNGESLRKGGLALCPKPHEQWVCFIWIEAMWEERIPGWYQIIYKMTFFFLKLDRFGETTWLSQICTLNSGPNSFQAFLKIRIWMDKRR